MAMIQIYMMVEAKNVLDTALQLCIYKPNNIYPPYLNRSQLFKPIKIEAAYLRIKEQI